MTDRPLRVLYVLNASEGGATQGIIEFLKGVPEGVVQAYLVVPDAPKAARRETFEQLAEELRVVQMGWWDKRIRVPLRKRLRYWLAVNVRTVGHLRPIIQLVRLIKRWNIDVVHTSTGLTPWGGIAARFCGVPHVWHVREWIGERGIFPILLKDRRLVRVMGALSDRIVLMSKFVGDVFERQGYTKNVTVIYDGVDLSGFKASNRTLQDDLAIGPDEVVVGMVANVTSTMKRHDVFIKMAARLAPRFPEARFVVFGFLPRQPDSPAGTYFAELEGLEERAALGERLVWAGHTTDIPALMNTLDVLVHPCDVEGFGRVGIEAMAAGCPIVVADAGGIAESVDDGRTGYAVASGDSTAFAEAVAQLLADPALRAQMGAAGKTYASEQFSIDKHVQAICALYQAVL